MKELVLKPTAEGGLSEIYLPCELFDRLSTALMWKRAEHYIIDLRKSAVIQDPCYPILQKRMEAWMNRLKGDGYVSPHTDDAYEDYTAIVSPWDVEEMYAYISQFFGDRIDAEFAKYVKWRETATNGCFEGKFEPRFDEISDLHDLIDEMGTVDYSGCINNLVPLEKQVPAESGYRLHPNNIDDGIATYFGRIEEYQDQPFYDQAQQFFGLHALFEIRSSDDFDFVDFDFDDEDIIE